jgi:transposase
MYLSDPVDGQWEGLEPLLRPIGTIATLDAATASMSFDEWWMLCCIWSRQDVNGFNCPRIFSRETVQEQFRRWLDAGVWERVGKTLREQGRRAAGRNATPTMAIIDSQSTKTTGKGDTHL